MSIANPVASRASHSLRSKSQVNLSSAWNSESCDDCVKSSREEEVCILSADPAAINDGARDTRSPAQLVIFGAKGFAELAHYYFTHDSPYTVVGFTVDAAYLQAATYKGLPVVAFEEVERYFPPIECDLFVAIGYHNLNQTRAQKAIAAAAKGYHLASFLSSKADVAPDLILHPNTAIMERAGIQPLVKIGSNAIVWSGTRIGFRSQLGNDIWIVSATLGESVTVGDRAFIGLNATIAPGVTIGEGNIIGAGALITHSTKAWEIYRGRASRASRVPSFRLRHF